MKIKLITMIVITLVLFATLFGCATDKGIETDIETGIPLPYENALIIDIKAEAEKLTVTTMESPDDFSYAIASAWETTNDGRTWKKLFETRFESDDPGKICVNAEIHLINQGGLISFIQWPKDNPHDDYCHTTYVEDFTNGQEKKVFSDYDLKNLAGTYYIDSEVVHGWDIMSFEMLTLNFATETVEKKRLDGIDMVSNVEYDKNYAYISCLTKDIKQKVLKYDFRKDKIVDSPVLDSLVKELGNQGYTLSPGVKIYPKSTGEKEEYYYVCVDGIFVYNELGSKQVSVIASQGSKEDTDVYKVEFVGGEKAYIYYYIFDQDMAKNRIEKVLLTD